MQQSFIRVVIFGCQSADFGFFYVAVVECVRADMTQAVGCRGSCCTTCNMHLNTADFFRNNLVVGVSNRIENDVAFRIHDGRQIMPERDVRVIRLICVTAHALTESRREQIARILIVGINNRTPREISDALQPSARRRPVKWIVVECVQATHRVHDDR